MTDARQVSDILAAVGSGLELLEHVGSIVRRRTPAARAAALRARASRKRVAAGRALTARGRARKLRRAADLEAEADRLDRGAAMSSCVVGYGAFVARSRVTPSRAVELAGAGLGALVLQVDWQGSKLRRRSVQQLRDEQDACAAAGLAVWWWAWCVPGSRRPEQLRQRLAGLVAEVGAPAGFIVDAEVDGGWSSSRPDLRPLATAARDVGMPLVGLTSHGMVGRRWPVEAFDVGLPQLYRQDPIDAAWAKHCLDTWARAPNCWPVLGCADPMSDAAAMQADLAALGELKLPGALWWTARQLVGARLAAAVPDPASWRGNSSETPKSSIRTYDGPLEVLG